MNQLVPIMWKNVLFTVWFQNFVTVFNQSYNCQTSHYLGRNRLPNTCLIVLSYLVFALGQNGLRYVFKWHFIFCLGLFTDYEHDSINKGNLKFLSRIWQKNILICLLLWIKMQFRHLRVTILTPTPSDKEPTSQWPDQNKQTNKK